jgi:hypothetical protein
VRCLSCKYDLRNLGEHRCPECGRAFDPDDPATFVSPISSRRKLRRYVVQIVTCALLSFMITYGCVFYVETTSPSTSQLDSAPTRVRILANTFANWPFTFVFLFIGVTFVLPRLTKK